MSHFTSLLVAFAWAGITTGLGAVLLVLRLDPSISGLAVIVVAAAGALLYAACLGALGMLSGITAALLAQWRKQGRSPEPGAAFVALAAGLSLLAGGFCLAAQGTSGILRVVVSLVTLGGSVTVATAIATFGRGLRLAGGAVAGLLGTLTLVVLGLLLVRIPGAGPPTGSTSAAGSLPMPATAAGSEADRQVILIGLDGADWKRIDPLVDEGRLPTIARLLEAGTRGPLSTFVPTLSPILWNTIATGQSPQRHGIHDFVELRIPGVDCGIQLHGLQRDPNPLVRVLFLPTRLVTSLDLLEEYPITSCHRSVKSVWNVLSDHGRRVAVVNWFASWPSEPLNGYVVSDSNPKRLAFTLDGEEPAAIPGGVTHPEELIEELVTMKLPGIGRSADEILASRFFTEISEADRSRLARQRGLLEVFRHIYESDGFSAAAAERVLGREPVDFLAVYLSGIDNVSHRFGRQAGVVDRYYEYVDGLLGSLLERADRGATVVVVSDHGWEYEDPETYAHFHGPDGIVLVAGGDARRGKSLPSRPSILDVAPTVLALFGIPPSRELEGSPIVEALSAEARQDIPPGRIASYGRYVPPRLSDVEEGGFDRGEEMRKLEALGYIQ